MGISSIVFCDKKGVYIHACGVSAQTTWEIASPKVLASV
jgi:hypothetical protein